MRATAITPVRWRKIVANISFGVLLIAVLGGAIIYSGLKFAGVDLYTVQTSSMQPTFGPGDVVGISSVKPFEIKEGDVVAYLRSGTNTPIVHRVREVHHEGYDVTMNLRDKDGNVVDTSTSYQPRTFVLRGDNNPIDDSEVVLQGQIIGRQRLVVPHPFNLLASRADKQALTAFGVAAIALYIAWEAVDGFESWRRKRATAAGLLDATDIGTP